ncbi:Transcriptional regulator, LysR family [Sphingobium indicum BiD32]|uniref:Transcriptional regulator, LysR family n=1 Tax=Sphingobium indicum BiD32 TaxID=1301087 RepID=N1MTR7_9SPHN|nr:LysR family transcriptional regulator [Sphingobium indicum]CCW19057.1 Transcriptional regulator, LysR family [Sphingobium indicum BiD32]
MDRIDAMRLFVRIVERRSFAAAARDLSVPRSSVTQGIQELERRLGAQLLQRTTRQVRPTLDGEAFYRRCLSIVADIEEAEAAFSGAKPTGLLRVDVHGTLARHFMMPGLPLFLETYPGIQLLVSEADGFVDLTRDGVDCVLRVGELPDSSLIGRRIATLEQGTFASPDYLDRHGVPRMLQQLDGHRMIGYMSHVTGEVIPLEFTAAGKVQTMILPASIMVTGAETNVSAARLGFGLIQVPRYRVAEDIAAGSLVEILLDFPPSALPVHVLYTRTRQLSPRVRVFVDWLAKEFAAKLPR